MEPSSQVHLLPWEEVPGAELLPVPHRPLGDAGGEAVGGHPHVPPHVDAGTERAGRLRVEDPQDPPQDVGDVPSLPLNDVQRTLAEGGELVGTRRGGLGSWDWQPHRSRHKVIVTKGLKDSRQ